MPLLDEHFQGPTFDSRLAWLNPPPSTKLDPDGLTVETAAGSDFWQRTHYGFRVDNGHALLLPVSGDFRLETEIHFSPLHQYDQAGLFVRLSEQCWLKTSIEFEGDAPSRLGSVVTNQGFSDWATQDVPPSTRRACYRITRRSSDYLIEHETGPGVFSQIRLAHLAEDDGRAQVMAGLYACSPKGAGFRATFRRLRVEHDFKAATAKL
jgi:regulation of enolase protein 1 (concanavalin A-like superfamily)